MMVQPCNLERELARQLKRFQSLESKVRYKRRIMWECVANSRKWICTIVFRHGENQRIICDRSVMSNCLHFFPEWTRFARVKKRSKAVSSLRQRRCGTLVHASPSQADLLAPLGKRVR